MAPKKSTSGSGRTKKAAGMAQVSSPFLSANQKKRRKAYIQPTLAFSQRKPGLAETKTKSSSSISATSLHRQQSNSSIDLTEDEPLSKSKVSKETTGKKDERKALNPKSKEWAGVYGDAKAAMGGMEPSKLT